MMKYRGFLLIVLACLLVIPFGLEAKTLADVRGELAKLEKEKQAAENKSAELQKEIRFSKYLIEKNLQKYSVFLVSQFLVGKIILATLILNSFQVLLHSLVLLPINLWELMKM